MRMFLLKRYFKAYFKFVFLFIILISTIAGLEFLLPLIIRDLFLKIELRTITSMNNALFKYFIIFSVLNIIKILYSIIRLKFSKVFTVNESKYLYYNLFNMKYKYF